jgi:hypothetical protein
MSRGRSIIESWPPRRRRPTARSARAAAHGLGEALHTAAAQDVINATYAPVTAVVARLVDACVAEVSVAPGHDPADVLLLRVAPATKGWRRGGGSSPPPSSG